MKKIAYALIFSALFLAGCGTSRKATRSTAPTGEPASEFPRVILYPKGFEGEMEPAITSGTYADVHLGMVFSGLETEHVRVKGVNPLPAAGRLEIDLDAMQGHFVYPYKGRFLSDFGMRSGRPHTGIDIKTIADDTIRAVLPGVVRMSKNYSSYGNIVVIRHPHGFETVYAHCSRNLVGVNDRVEAGTPIGLAGRTGRATTEHLHFEIRVAGEPLDPKKMLDIENEGLRGGMFYAEEVAGRIVAYNHPMELAGIKREIEEAARAEKEPPPQKTPPALLPESVAITPSGNADAPRGNTASSGSSGDVRYHTVVKGDTLYALARKYSTTVKELCRINNIEETDILSLGQKLRVK
ncbi:MAG: peptidoglycan DD-metalloendopeptidase family protein [Rikenellaceae bacterium]|nr:peptidoglycan DD-metalloendopeptidase family protein [Rikenellaceae bacterium]